jgi:hypothetical protein
MMRRAALLPLIAALLPLAGCRHGGLADGQTPSPLLPKSIRLHPFTGARDFGDKGGGIEANVEIKNYFDDATMALGTFQFSMYRYRPHEDDPRGERIGFWTVDLTNPKTNQQYWDSISRTYKVPLAWDKPVKAGKKFVLEVTFAGPGGPRLFDRIIRTSGGDDE